MHRKLAQGLGSRFQDIDRGMHRGVTAHHIGQRFAEKDGAMTEVMLAVAKF
ncbi:hypothetical protein GCM10023333_22370 [Ferrimonas pelagia]|uniref:Uncharacterized protein n=1 Tax=Ferrimonas pelagia TaxID=1177826 RepID=A0ABP9EY06_9GAMM